MSTTQNELKDIFGQVAKVGDKIAAGMLFSKSSVLRIGEIIAIKEVDTYYSGQGQTWSIRVKWTNNGANSRWGVKESSIKVESNYTYAKFVILPPDFVSQFPPDIKDEDDSYIV